MHRIILAKQKKEVQALADRIFASVVNQKTVTQIQLQVLTVIAAQIASVIEAQLGIAAQFDDDLLDI